MRRLWSSLPVLALLVLASLLPAFAPAAAVQEASDHALRVNWGPPIPDTLDPQHSDEGQWAISGGLDFEGLTRIDESLQPVPGAAESWQFSPVGKTITFHLREGLVYSDGAPVLASQFVYAAERMCSPELNSRSVSLLADVIGCMDLFNSAGDETAADAAKGAFGVRALDDRTVEYRFTRPAPYFLVTAANWGCIPLRQDLIEAGGPEWWANPATRVGNGPFKMTAYPTNGLEEHLVYARNDRYWAGRTTLDRLEFLFLDLADPATMVAYQRGDIDATFPTEETIPALEADPALSRELVHLPVAGTDYFEFNFTKAPFQDKKVREAFAYAFDRARYCRELLYDACTPTLSMVAPGAPGYIDTEAYAFNPEKARLALAESSYGGPETLPQITWYGWKDDPGGDKDAPWLYQQFRQVLGVELNVVYLTDEEHDALYDDSSTYPQLHDSTWWNDGDPRDWFVIWRCDSEYGDEGFCDPELDNLLDRADSEMDPARRIALYEDAGRMLVADVPAIFVNSVSVTMLVKPYVSGYSRTIPNNGPWPGWTNLMTVDVARPA
jgi:oligopeptide transport system substrate-binding protein